MRNALMLLLLLPAGLSALSGGQPAPAFTTRDLNGWVWTQKTAPDGYLLVDFWASWCVPCLQEIPTLNALEAEYGPKRRLYVLGLSLDKGGAPAVRAAAARFHVAYPVAPVDPKVAESYGIAGFPSAFLIKGGKVVMVLSGHRDLSDFKRELAPYLDAP